MQLALAATLFESLQRQINHAAVASIELYAGQAGRRNTAQRWAVT
jgi:hypothetical protein